MWCIFIPLSSIVVSCKESNSLLIVNVNQIITSINCDPAHHSNINNVAYLNDKHSIDFFFSGNKGRSNFYDLVTIKG